VIPNVGPALARRAAGVALTVLTVGLGFAPCATAAQSNPSTTTAPTTPPAPSSTAPSSTTPAPPATTTTTRPAPTPSPRVHAADVGPSVDYVNQDRAVVVPGQPVTWTISVSNPTGADIATPSVAIDLPNGLNLNGAVQAGDWSCSNTGSNGPTTITCADVQTWPTGSQLTITVPTIAASPVGNATVQVTAQPGGASNSGTTDIVAPTTAQLAAHVSPNASPPTGGQLTITEAITFGAADARYAFVNLNTASGLTIDQASADNNFNCNINSGNVNCNGDPVPAGTTVTLTVNATVTASDGASIPVNLNGGATNVANNLGTNINLDVGGVTLSGRVTINDNPYSDTPIQNICVNANPYNGGSSTGSSSTDSFGDFQLAVPANATYRVQYNDCNQPATYGQLYYQNTPDYNAATPVAAATSSISGLDARMTAGHSVSGTVRDNLAQPVSGVQVSIQDPNSGNWISGGNTAADGTWTSWAPVPPGSYVVHFQPPNHSLSDQWWDHQATQATATTLSVAGGTDPITNINADLTPAVSISGVVGASNQGIGGLCVQAYTGGNPLDNNSQLAMTQSAPDGSYTLDGLPSTAGVKILVRDCRPQPTLAYGFYTPSGPTSSYAAATPVTGPATGINLFLNGGASISGKVTDAQTGQPLSQVCAAAIDLSTGVPVFIQPINADGTYTLNGLAPGTYYAASGDCQGNTRPLEWYDGSYGIPFNSNGPIDPVADHAKPIPVAGGATVTGIDFRLGTPPPPSVGFVSTQVASQGASTVTFTINRTDGDTSIPSTVAYGTVNGTGTSAASSNAAAHDAVAGTDYIPASGTLSFAPYQTSQTVTVQLTPAGMANLGAQFSLALSNLSVGSIRTGVSTATITGGAAGAASAGASNPAGNSLALTGAGIAGLALAGLALVVAGTLLRVAGRRRRA
jgi:hypothetical protein